jgi:hypothetical protein
LEKLEKLLLLKTLFSKIKKISKNDLLRKKLNVLKKNFKLNLKKLEKLLQKTKPEKLMETFE